MENPSASTAEPVERCDLCGTPLALSAGAPGCLHCLLAGGRDGAEERRYQHYEVAVHEDGVTLSELGRGAMGITYRALDLNLGAPVALKVISARYSNQREARDRFRREAQAAAQLRHPNVASVYHFGETAAGQCFYAMELVEGETLESRVRCEGPLGAGMVLEVALQVARALLAAEKHGLVHRDLKPSNLMLVPNESGNDRAPGVKVIDFGLAKAVTDAEEVTEPTRTGFAGTPGFASPEQSQAEGRRLDTRSDIYSLGATLWYALTEEVPPPGVSLPVERLVAQEVPGPMIRLLRRALATDPAERAQSARAFLAELELCQAAMEAAPRRRQRLRRAALVLGLIALSGAGLTGYLLQRHHAAVPMAPEKSIAVLPFANLSAAKENAFFAEGVQDDILTALAKIADLKVISRASVMNYGVGPGRDLREIGQALGVTKVLEGSVRRAGDKVRVTAQLIDTRTNTQLWAESYDRGLADIFAVEVEVAESVAAALQTVIRPEEKARVQAKPTENADAYVLYLRAREYQTRPTGLLQDYQTAADLYTQALALDPRFALAHARLSATLAYTYLNFLPKEEIKRRARAEAEEALRLQPDLGEARVARALCLYWTEKNYEAALHELKLAAQLLPNDAEIDVFSAFICRRQGRWRAAIAGMERASARDPRNSLLAREVMLTNWLVRDWLAAARGGDRALALAPDLPLLRVERTYLDIWSKGELAPLRAALTAIPPGSDPDGEVTLARWDAALLGRDFAAAERAVAALQSENALTPHGAPLPKDYLRGCIEMARGQSQRAEPFLESARPAMEAEARAFPLDPFRQAHLGLLYAHLGRKEDALRQGHRAVELLPESKDALYGPTLSGLLALIYARTGESDQAMTLLERLLTVPGPVSQVSEGSITLSDLRLRWQWDPLRGDPRFQKIIAGPEPKTILVANLAPDSVPTLTTPRALFQRDGTQTPANIQGGLPVAISGKSIAVLPFDNLSRDPENAFFADGIQDDILTSLTKISELKVISRTSVKQYRGEGVARNLREIARTLEVANVLEGSVRRADNRVLVSVQLIDASNDRHIWAERYDRTLADSIGLQGELATEIATALKAKLAPEERTSLGTKPTSNPEAYVAFLRALDYEQNADVPVAEYYATLDRFYAQAITLDPAFALAHARASINYSNEFWQTHDPALREKAQSEAEEALRLAPTLGEAHLASGLYSYLAEGDYGAALEQFTIALTALPNNVEVLQSIARIYRKQGRWREAIAGFSHARNLNPLADPAELVRTYWMVRDWRSAVTTMQRNLQRLPPDVPFARIGLAQIEVVAHRNLAAARAQLREIPAGADPDGEVTLANWNLSMLERDWVGAEKWLSDFKSDEFPDIGPKTYYQAQTALARGDVELARTLLEKVRAAFEKELRDHPDDSQAHASLGKLYGYMGRKEQAIREARRAVELCPESTDALNGAQREYDLALVYAITGEVDQAVTLIERLLRTPGATLRQHFWDGGITQAELRLRWQWDKLRSEPRFQRILDGPEPKTIY